MTLKSFGLIFKMETRKRLFRLRTRCSRCKIYTRNILLDNYEQLKLQVGSSLERGLVFTIAYRQTDIFDIVQITVHLIYFI